MIDLVLGKFLHVPRGHHSVVLRLFLYSFFLAATYQMGRTAADSIFLARLGVATLPNVFLLSGIVVALTALLGSFLTRHFSFRVVATGLGGMLGCITLITTLLLPEYHHSQYLLGAIYLTAELRGAVGAISIGWATHELIPKENRFSFAAVGLSVPIAGILLGLVMGLESYSLPTASWLVIAGIVDFIAILPMWFGRKAEQHLPETIHDAPINVDKNLPARNDSGSKYRLQGNDQRSSVVGTTIYTLSFAILALSFFKFVTLTIVAFEWKKYTEVYFGTNEQELTVYFSAYYAVTHFLTIVLQAAFVGRLLHRKSFRWVLTLMPIILFLLAAMLIGFASPVLALGILTCAKGMDSWRRSVGDTGIIVLISRVPKGRRQNLISLNNGFVKPFAEIYAATVVWFLANWSADFSVWIWAGAASLWCIWTIAATGRST